MVVELVLNTSGGGGDGSILCNMNSTINNRGKSASLAGAMRNSIERGSLV